jgi:starch-binding outer membrane protein, SusD/RagB family
MTRNRYFSLHWLWLALLLPVSGCLGDLDQVPPTELTSAAVYNDIDNYRAVLAKCYAGLALSGQQGPAGNPDIAGIDEGFSQYLRQYWKAQELPTDEAVIGWNDGSLPDYNTATWGAGNEFVAAMYNRIFYQVVLCNELIRETAPDKLDERGFSADQISTIDVYRAEARFLRALSYWHAIDLFGNVPFVTEEDPVGAIVPEQISRSELFTYLESELLDLIEGADLVAPGQNEYGRADKAAARVLLAKLYLNAAVYVGADRSAEALAQCEAIISSGAHQLDDDYESLFLTDNHTSPEIIFPIPFDGLRTRTFGGMTFLVHAPVGGTMNPDDFGINGGWFGLRATFAFTSKFDPDYVPQDSNSVYNPTDQRALVYTDGQAAKVQNISSFEDGFAIAKYKNVRYENGDTIAGSDPTGDHIDTDYPMFRLADVYLMYAEAHLRSGAGSQSDALGYVNQLRIRAGAAEIGAGDMTLDFLLDERARELYWEAHRRTDLIRFGLFAGDQYRWEFKGGPPNGTAIPAYRRLFPIPAADLIANPNLEQNPGY